MKIKTLVEKSFVGATFKVSTGKMSVQDLRKELQAIDKELATWGDAAEIEVADIHRNRGVEVVLQKPVSMGLEG